MIIPAGYAQVNFVFTGSNLPTGAECTLGLEVDGYAGTPQDLAEDCYNAWRDNMLAVQVSTTILSEARIKMGPNDTGANAAFAGTNGGAIGSAAISPNVAVLVSKNTIFGGRAGRGRFFYPGTTESDTQGDGGVDAAYLAAAQTAVDGLWTDLTAVSALPSLLHGADSPLSVPTPIGSFTVQSRVATQRRRLRR